MRLAGEWTLRWQPAAEDAARVETGPPFLTVPGAWNGLRVRGEPLPGLGFATHSLQVRLPPGPPVELALALGEAHSAERWWLNGRLLLERGRVGRTRDEEAPWAEPRLVRFVPEGQQIDLVVEVSNHFHFEGGLVHAPWLGPAATLETQAARDANLDFLLIGCLGVVSLYYATLCLSRFDRSHALFAAVTLLMAVRTATLKWHTTAWLGAPGQLRLDYLTLYLAPPLYLAFVAELFPQERTATGTGLQGRLVRLALAFGLIGAATTVALPSHVYTNLRLVAMLTALLVTAVAFLFVVKAARERREGAWLVASSCLVVVVVAVHDVLSRQRLIPEARELLPLANTVMVFAHAVVLGRRIRGAQRESESMAASLRDLNLRLEERILERTKELERLATTDSLTGLINRGQLLLLAEAEHARARRHGHDLAVMVIDADHFKAVNDSHGHDAGDAVLRQLGSELLGLTRAHDILGRWGGEEFVLALPHLDREGARGAAERYREGLSREPIALPDGGSVRITVSVGVAVARPDESFEQVLRRADLALYAAKAEGRNRVMLAPD